MGGFDDDGHAIVEGVLDDAACDAVLRHLDATATSRAGSRNLLDAAWCRDLALGLKARVAIARSLPPAAAWHQDLSIPVRARISAPVYAGWSEKEGVLYVQPPTALLESLVAVRLHLDASTADNGPLRVVPRSHREGRLGADEVQARRRAEITCLVPRGGALLMRPLLLHASSKVTGSGHRRVLHFVFGPARLPDGLAWHHAV